MPVIGEIAALGANGFMRISWLCVALLTVTACGNDHTGGADGGVDLSVEDRPAVNDDLPLPPLPDLLEQTDLVPPGPPDLLPGTLTAVPVGARRKIDLLFMVDNSPSMQLKQAELKTRFGSLLKIIDDLGTTNPAWYHIGVITSDLGAGAFNLGAGQCKPGGMGGKLVALGAAADASCQPPTGASFIDYNQIDKTNNLPSNDLAATFSCMASVGDTGCGFEQPLEAVYQALHAGGPAENAGFLRDDALLVVVFLTDEDDCSVPPTTDLFDPAKSATYGALLSYRCSNYGIVAGTPPALLPYGDSGGPLANPHGATMAQGGKLYDESRYVDLFTKSSAHGGLKLSPDDLIVATISGPATMVSTLLANPNPVPPGPYVACPGPISPTCGVVLQHACVSPTNTQFFADPAVRLHDVVSSVSAHVEGSVCEDFLTPMQSIGAQITDHLGGGCLADPLASVSNPNCVVQDKNGSAVTPIPACASNNNATPCWRMQEVPTCTAVTNPVTNQPQRLRLVVDRGAVVPPAATVTSAQCELTH